MSVAGRSPPGSFLASCTALLPEIGVYEAGLTVEELIRPLSAAAETKLRWELTGDGAYILRRSAQDQLSGATNTLDIQLRKITESDPNPHCTPGLVLVERAISNGVELSLMDRNILLKQVAGEVPAYAERALSLEQKRQEQAASATVQPAPPLIAPITPPSQPGLPPISLDDLQEADVPERGSEAPG